MDLGLAGRGCVVTGASRGIGRETARQLCAEGATVLLVARGAERLAEAAEECRAGAARPAPRRWRSTSPPRTPASGCSRPPSESFGALDVLVNNAGSARWRDLDEVPDEDWRGQYELNVMAPLRAMRAAAPGDGRARLGPGRQRLLDRRQAALGGDARVLGREGGRALALAPLRRPPRAQRRPRQRDLPRPGRSPSCGWSPGGLLDQSQELSGAGAARRRSRRPASKRPIGRLAEVGEIAAAIVFLCSERASYVSGAAWSVDGGTVQVII